MLRGEALLLIEGEEHPLRQWDFAHCPAGAAHAIVGAGAERCLLLAVGARERSTAPTGVPTSWMPPRWRHGCGVEVQTSDPRVAHARFGQWQPCRYGEGWLPESG